MELALFFKFLIRNFKVLILIPIVTVLITYFLVKSLPDSYIAQGQISTGIVDKSDEINLTNAPPLQQSEIEQKFSNLIQMMQMQKLLRLTSYKLIIHDLTEKTFKPFSSEIQELTPKQRDELVILAKNKYKTQQPLSRGNPKEAHLEDLISSMKYDIGSLKDKLSISRVAQSDYISVSFESSNPDLSSYVVNSVSTEFINHYTNIIKQTGEKSVNYLSKLLIDKQKDLNNKMSILKHYKIQNNVLNLPEQARIIFGQMLDVEDRQAEVQKQIVSITGAIRAIDQKFNPRDRKYFEAAASKVNAEIVSYKEKSKALSDKYVDNDFDPIYKRMYDSIQVLTTNKINEASDEAIFNPLAVKQDLIGKKIGLQTELELARNSVSTLDRLHDKLFGQFRRLVPFEASIQSYERDIEIASQEYLDILDRYNNTSMQTTFVATLKLTQPALPGALQPSKKMLLIILSGIISFVFCIVILFILFYFDDSIQSAKQLANTTELPVIGQLDLISNNKLNFKDLWSENLRSVQLINFKDQLRALRFELNQELKDDKILAITSCTPGDGKTFLSLNLAYTYAVTNKRVLIIDGNFMNPELTKSVHSENSEYIEDFFLNSDSLSHEANSTITVLGNKGGGKSILELATREVIQARFDHLKSFYDLILIETPALTSTESSKEWILFTDKVIAVFAFKEYITEATKVQLNYLKSLDDQFTGWVLNKFPASNAPKISKKNKV